MRKNVWGFISLICKTKQLDSLSVANIHWSRLFRRWLGVYVKIKIVYTLWPTDSTSEYLSPKDMSPKKQYLTVKWGPLTMCLLKNVFVNQSFGHNWFKQLYLLKVFWDLLICLLCSETLNEWACLILSFLGTKSCEDLWFGYTLRAGMKAWENTFSGLLIGMVAVGSYYAINHSVQEAFFYENRHD